MHPGLIVSENISGFGTVYKTEATFTSLPMTFTGTSMLVWHFVCEKLQPNLLQSSDAKTLGTQVGSDGTGSGNQRTVTVTETNVGTKHLLLLCTIRRRNKDYLCKECEIWC